MDRDRPAKKDKVIVLRHFTGAGTGGDDLDSVPHVGEAIPQPGDMLIHPPGEGIIIRRNQGDFHFTYRDLARRFGCEAEAAKPTADSACNCPEMNSSVIFRACSSVYCIGGDFIK